MARNIQSPTQPDFSAGAEFGPASPGIDARTLSALQPRMLAVALRTTRDPDAARDVVQNASEKIWRNRNQFRGDSRLSTWAHRIVVNEALMWLRSRRRRDRRLVLDDSGSGLSENLPDPSPEAPSSLERHHEIRRVRRGIASLSPDERDVLQHCALEGWSYERYGRSRGLGTAAVKSRAFRARRRLAHLLAS